MITRVRAPSRNESLFNCEFASVTFRTLSRSEASQNGSPVSRQVLVLFEARAERLPDGLVRADSHCGWIFRLGSCWNVDTFGLWTNESPTGGQSRWVRPWIRHWDREIFTDITLEWVQTLITRSANSNYSHSCSGFAVRHDFTNIHRHSHERQNAKSAEKRELLQIL